MKPIWRGVRSRGWRAVLAVVLLTLALAAHTIVFSAADALATLRPAHAATRVDPSALLRE